jgi:predicted transcriptional regulator
MVGEGVRVRRRDGVAGEGVSSRVDMLGRKGMTGMSMFLPKIQYLGVVYYILPRIRMRRR